MGSVAMRARADARHSASYDTLSVNYHGLAHTHYDALAHHFYSDGSMYNGFKHKENFTLPEGGATKNSVINVKNGVFTRGILIDIPRLKGVPYLEPGTSVYIEDIEAWEKQTGIKVGAGDALFIRVGRWARRAKLGAENVGNNVAGVDGTLIPWLKQDAEQMGVRLSEEALLMLREACGGSGTGSGSRRSWWTAYLGHICGQNISTVPSIACSISRTGSLRAS